MKNVDLEYLCRVIGNLSGIPIRIYKKRTLKYYYSVVPLPADPISPYIDKVFNIKENIGYFTTPYFNYYGIINSKNVTVVIGPSRQAPMNEKDLRSLAFECGVESTHTEDFILGMKALVQMPLGSIIQILCTMNYVMNGEKLSLEDVSILEIEQEHIEFELVKERLINDYESFDE